MITSPEVQRILLGGMRTDTELPVHIVRSIRKCLPLMNREVYLRFYYHSSPLPAGEAHRRNAVHHYKPGLCPPSPKRRRGYGNEGSKNLRMFATEQVKLALNDGNQHQSLPILLQRVPGSSVQEWPWWEYRL